jgi:hypothetical protein
VSDYHKSKIKVVGPDLSCFPVDAETLTPLACSTYDPWALADPDPDVVETISHGEWLNRYRNTEAGE